MTTSVQQASGNYESKRSDMAILLKQTFIETKLFFRRRSELLWTLAFPIMFMVLFGLIYGNTTWSEMNIRAVDFLLPGIIVMGAMVTGIMRTSVGFVGEREKGIYRRLALTPLKRQTLIGSQLIQHLIVIIVQTMLLIVIGVNAFNIHISGNMALFWLVMSIAALCFMSIGFALTGLIKTARSATPINQMAYFLLMFLGGIFFPNSMLPGWLEKFASILPSTQASDAIRAIFFQSAGFGDVWQNLVIMGAWIIACLAVSIKFFRWE
jgi:ABC-2 type transport system permease protein